MIASSGRAQESGPYPANTEFGITTHSISTQLASALATENLDSIRAAVSAARQTLGAKAGIPEAADKFEPVLKANRWLTSEEARHGFTPYYRRLEQSKTWHIGMDPTTLTQPLRAQASIVSGLTAACRAKLDGREHGLRLARENADFLVWAQAEAGAGVFPFPAVRNLKSSKPFEAADRFLTRADQAGRLNEFVRNGWLIEDDGDGGLQFDNGESGVALFELYELTGEEKYLASARRAADWAAVRPLAPNWNYNSFSVYLLAKAYAVTSNSNYLSAATKKALLGVIPGQLAEGPHMGRWFDPHNARPAYHYILLRSLAQLAGVMPWNNPDRATVLASLQLGLRARNAEILNHGVPNKDKAIETLLIVNRFFPGEEEFLHNSLAAEALDALGRLVSEQSRRGTHPLGPREWGLFLEWIVSTRERH
jgi:hypothetical protein